MKYVIAVLGLAMVLSASAASAHFGVDHTGADHSHAAQNTTGGGMGTSNTTADQPEKPKDTCDQPGVVSLAGEVILRIHAPAGGMDCQQRADKVQTRIIDALSIGVVYPRDIYVKKFNNEWAVFVKDILIITADQHSAKINKTTPQGLAGVWARNLQRTIPESTPQKPM